jgi:hypothetical protein
MIDESVFRDVNMGQLNKLVSEIMHPYRGRSEEDIRAWELEAIRERVNDLVAGSPFAGEFRLLVGFNEDGALGTIVWPNDDDIARA